MPEPERALKALSDRLRNGAGGNDHLYRRQVATKKRKKNQNGVVILKTQINNNICLSIANLFKFSFLEILFRGCHPDFTTSILQLSV